MSIAEVLRIDPNNLFQVRSLIQDLSPEEKEQKINEPDELGDTALHVAASKGQVLVVKYLVQNGADFNIPNKAGSTPMHKAFLSGSKGVVDYLLKNEPDWIPNHSGLTPFSFAREILRNDRELFHKLLDLENSSHSETMLIPYSKLPFIIGKQGRMLDIIRVEYQTDVVVPPRPRDSDPREDDCEIKLTARTKEEAELAKQKIENLMLKEQERKIVAAEKIPTEKEEISDWASTVETEEKKQAAAEKKAKKSKVAEKDADLSLFSRNLHVPKEHHRFIVRDSDKFQEIRNTGATIIIPRKEDPNETIIIRGEPNEVDEAIRLINTLVKKAKGSDLPEKKIFVAKDKHKFVIGKGGANVKRLKETFKVNVIVPNSKTTDEYIVVQGELANIENAKYDIYETINYRDGPKSPGGFRDDRGGRPRGGGGGRRGGGGGDGEGAWSGGRNQRNRHYDEEEEKPVVSPQKQVPTKLNLKNEEDWPVWPST